MSGKLSILNANQLSIPGLGDYGGFGNGDRLILMKGTGSTFPHSIGVNTNTTWYSVPS
jgi:hypothetical protein